MFDKMLLLASAVLVGLMGFSFLYYNTGGNVGPMFVGSLCFLYAGTVLYALVREEF